jgi:hypothetical protein
MFVLGGIFMGYGSSCSSAANNKENEIKDKGVIEYQVANLSRIELHNEVGNIEVKPAANDSLQIGIEKIVEYGTKELAAELFEKIQVTVRDEEATVFIDITGWECKDEIIAAYKDVVDITKVNFKIDFVLEVPANLNNMILSTAVGNITATELTGALDFKASTGNIVLNNEMKIIGNSSFKAGVGNVDITLQEVDSTEAITIEVQTGNINLSLPDALNCTLEIESFMKKKQTVAHNGGGVIIKANSGVGNVNYSFL